MIELITGAALVYAVGIVQVYRAQRERRSSQHLGPDLGRVHDLKIALRWPVIVGPQG